MFRKIFVLAALMLIPYVAYAETPSIDTDESKKREEQLDRLASRRLMEPKTREDKLEKSLVLELYRKVLREIEVQNLLSHIKGSYIIDPFKVSEIYKNEQGNDIMVIKVTVHHFDKIEGDNFFVTLRYSFKDDGFVVTRAEKR